MSTQPGFEIDSATRARIEELAAASHSTPQAVLEEALADYADRYAKRSRFYQDALAAVAEYEATGLHLTGEEVDAWLAKLEAGEDAELPPCHT